LLVAAVAATLFGWSSAWTMEECGPIIIDLLMGEPIPFDMMLDDLATVRIVYLGEFHTIARHHELQVELLRQLAEKGIKTAVGMEMFSEPQQPVLERWLQEGGSISDLVKELGKEHWTNLRDYEALLQLARDLRVPVVALNAPDTLVRTFPRGGRQALSEAERRQIPEDLDRIDPAYDRLLRLRLRVHRAFESKSLDRIVMAQALRDATMARNIVRFLNSEPGKDRVMVVIAGGGHVNYGFGIPERVKHTSPFSYRIVLPTESGQLVLSEAEKRESVPVHITHEDLRFIRVPIADYLHVTPLTEQQQEEGEPAAAPDLEARRSR